MKNTNYIGLATTCHDPAIAIIDRNGTILYAESTERFLQNKRAWNIIPDNFLQSQRIIKKYCDKDADLIISTTWSNKFSLFVRFFAKPIMYFLLHFYAFGIPSELLAQYKVLTSGMLANNELNCTNLIHQALLSNSKRSIKIRDFDHHYTHAAVACYSSPFNDALCAIIDGRGEFSSTAFYSYKDGILRRIKKIKPSLGSLGFFYAYLCAACGWDPLKGEEWKVMGLASYGKFNKDFYEKLKSLLIVKNSQIIKRKSYKDI